MTTDLGRCTWCDRRAAVTVEYTEFDARFDDPVTGPSRWVRTRWPRRLADLGSVLSGKLGRITARSACRDHLPALWAELRQRWGMTD